MTSNFFSPEHRPDPAHWTRTNVGLTSPLWWPFLMSAGAGAAWWTYTKWGRIAATSWTGDLQRLAGSDGEGGVTQPLTAAASLEQSLAVQGGAPGEDAEEDDAGVDDGSDAIDAAYAANLGPVPAPRKRASAKSAGGSASKRPAAKAAAKKTPAAKRSAKKAPPQKAPAKNAAAKKTAAKKAPAKNAGRKR